jgi:GT2 family glycosyltransferase
MKQTVVPDEWLIVDDGELPDVPHVEACRDRGIDVSHIRKERPGLTESRNIGMERSRGDLVFFFDDDAVVAADYIKRTVEVFGADPAQEIGGVGGIVANTAPMTFSRVVRFWWDVLWGLSGTKEGHMLRSGYAADIGETPFPIRSVTDVEFLFGGACAYRREVADGFRFTPGFHDRAYGEDKDFCLKVGQHYRLVLQPAARIDHYPSPASRPGRRDHGRRYVLGIYAMFAKYGKRCPADWLWFYYSTIGYVLTRLGIAMLRVDGGDFDHFRGALDALVGLARGRYRAPLREQLEGATS